MKLRDNQSVICIMLVMWKLLYFLLFLSVDQWGTCAACSKTVAMHWKRFVFLKKKKKSAREDEK